MKKTILVLLLTISLLFTAMFVSIPVGAAPEGTAVSTVAEFEAITDTGKYYLTGDIDFGGKVYDKGYIVEAFSGTLDGQGHSIYNYSLINTNGLAKGERLGVFRIVTGSADTLIKNISFGTPTSRVLIEAPNGDMVGGVVGAQAGGNTYLLSIDSVKVYADIVAYDTTSSENCIGGFVGYSANIEITDCKAYGSIKVGSGIDIVDTKYNSAGGFIGKTRKDIGLVVTITNCENNADIEVYCTYTPEDKGISKAGGFIGHLTNNNELTTLVDCINNGNITCHDTAAQKSYSFSGGFIGQINASMQADLTDCANYGEISGSRYVGGFIGRVGAGSNGNADLTRCTNYGKYTLTAEFNGPFYGAVLDGANISATLVECVDLSETPLETTPAGSGPDETTPVETTPAETTPAETTPVETTPADTTPDETTPDETTPDESSPDETSGKEGKGCGSVLGLGLFACLIPAAAVISKKKR